MSNNKASSNNESIILNEPILDRREDSSEVYGTGDERIINRTITIQAAIKSTLPDYLKIFITELALGACFFASSNEYMKVNKKTKESIIIIKNLERFSIPIIIKTLEATNIMITERIGHQNLKMLGKLYSNHIF